MPQFYDRRLRFIGSGLAAALIAGELHHVPHYFFEVVAPGHERPIGSVIAIPHNSSHNPHTHSDHGPTDTTRPNAMRQLGPTGAAGSGGFGSGPFGTGWGA